MQIQNLILLRSSWLNYVDEHENAYYYENLNVDSFLYLVKNSIALIGNSSSGIIETPSLEDIQLILEIDKRDECMVTVLLMLLVTVA